MATTAGNLLQRTRCPYFYDTNQPCNKREPGSGCSAIGGFSRQHAVIGVSDACIATHPSDMAVAMRVLDAVVETIRPDGSTRKIAIAEFHRLPGNEPHIDTVLMPGELITAVTLPKPVGGKQIYLKVRDRASFAFALISIAAIIQRDGNGRVFADGLVTAGGRRGPLAEAAGQSELVAEDAIEYGDLDKKFQQSTFGAHFVEVGVDFYTVVTRVRRMLAVCAAGRILNPKSARSQVIGAMTMGVGAALMEDLVVDKRVGFFVNHDLAGYEVPVHADIPHQEVIFLDETDPISSPMKAKGVGELGLCGVGAAVANAIYNATGIRVRDYPITLDKLIDQLPEIA
jgi:Molybdopterin-binding domain of aldehyde dehydrogenase/FAD binding domain in molybdopterin dehydrogenase